MKITVCVAIGIVIDIPDGGLPVGVPVVHPLDELAARLRREASFGRDSVEPGFAVPDLAAWLAAYYQSAA